MKNQFVYKQKVELQISVEGQEKQYKEIQNSFSLDIVLLSIETPTGRTVVLNHVHERAEQVPIKNKQGKVTAIRNERGMYQTEVALNQEDSERFLKVTSVDVE